MNLEKLFHLKENHTDVKTEVMAGITTFMTMAYILAVNPNILSASGMDRGAVFTATALSSFIATCLMALLSNYPFVLAPGMGLNAYFAYTVVLGMGYSWEQALVAVFVEGIIFILLSLTNVREAIFNSIPMTLKHAVSVGIGLFIAFIGLQNAKIVVNNDSTLVSMFSFKGSMADGSFKTIGITVLLALIGVLVTAILLVKNVKGGILWGILITWGLGILCQFIGLYVPDVEAGFFSLLPDFSNGISVPSMAPTFMKMDFAKVFSLDFVVIMFAFLFVDMFDTLGTLIGVASKADMLDQDGKLPRIKGALLSDAVGTTVGAMCGTSTVTTFVESASGVAEGGRTGLTPCVTGALFILTLFFSPVFLMIPSVAITPALVMVGIFMMEPLKNIDLSDFRQAMPAFFAMAFMTFTYNIAYGILFAFVTYTLGQIVSGNLKKMNKTMIILGIISLVYIVVDMFI